MGQLSPAAGQNALPPNSDFPKWYVKLGLLGVLNESSSKSVRATDRRHSRSRNWFGSRRRRPQEQLPGRGATYSNIVTAGIQAGYFFAQNWSLELTTGFPVWMTARISGFSGTAPVSGTELARILPSLVPMTIVYHFSQFGGVQPYLGAGIAPSFTLAARDGFSTGVSFNPTIGLILQGGVDYMFTRNLGLFVDVKKGFIDTTGRSTGIDLGPGATIATAGAIKTNFRPWLFTTGLVCRF